jgi:hypothetical protein
MMFIVFTACRECLPFLPQMLVFFWIFTVFSADVLERNPVSRNTARNHHSL